MITVCIATFNGEKYIREQLNSILFQLSLQDVMLNWLWKYVSYNDSIRMITYATKPKEVRDRLKREQTTHLGTDLLENEEEEEEA